MKLIFMLRFELQSFDHFSQMAMSSEENMNGKITKTCFITKYLG